MKSDSESLLLLRLAQEADCEPIYQWRNHPETRNHFINSAPLSLKDHSTWFFSNLKSKASILLIGEVRGEAVGVVRFDFKETQAEISIYVVPGKYRQGYGSALLTKSAQYLKEHHPEISIVIARVMPENKGSHQVFLKNGYIVSPDHNSESGDDTIYQLNLDT